MPARAARIALPFALLALACQERPASSELPSASASSSAPPAEPFPIREIATWPRPGATVPTRVRFSPGGDLVTYLHSAEGSMSRKLYGFDPKTGRARELVKPPGAGITEDNLSREEKLRRERQRERGLGITRYEWAKDRARLLVPIRGDLYVQDGADGGLRLVLDANGKPALDPRLSPSGELIAYVQDAELYAVSADGGDPRQLTRGARGTGKTHGLAEYIAQEEMRRHHGFWWSMDGEHLAFEEVDETHIPEYRIVHQGSADTGEASREDHRYPFAGGPNAKVRLGVVAASGGPTKWMDLGFGEGEDPNEYLARVHWMPDGALVAELQNREQTRLDIVRLDPKTGKRKLLFREKAETWINLHRAFRALKKGEGDLEGGFLWASERTGYRHLYLYGRDGQLVRQLTRGEWVVDDVAAIDEKSRRVYFLATKDEVTERHLYSVGFDGGEPRRSTDDAGYHSVEVDPDSGSFVDIASSLAKPPTVRLRSLGDGKVLHTIVGDPDPRVASLGLGPPELVQLKARDGVELRGALYRPDAKTAGPPPYPLLLSVYGGPHVQKVANRWSVTSAMRDQYFRGLGFVVFRLDNRGSARRGVTFEGALRHDMGNIEVKDQVDGVRWLVAQGLADAKRVGIYGWSYGGYLAAMALARAPEVFHAAVAGAPVSHWDGYDTHYTERYMGLPAKNQKGYRESSVMHHVPKMKGRLLLVHGLIDENVHFRHTARLLDALVKHQKEHEIVLFPSERHTPRSEKDREYMERRVRDFLVEAVMRR